MPRLLRPHIPLEVRCRVLLRQLGEMWPDDVINRHRAHQRDVWAKALGVRHASSGGFALPLETLMARLAEVLCCPVGDLRLDHDPALGAREKVMRHGEHVGYRPAANDPEFLRYREKHAHHIKTNVRGDGAQHPDRVLIKRERQRFTKSANKSKPKRKWAPGRKIESRPFQSRR